MTHTIHARLCGVTFANRQTVIAGLEPGDPIQLIREADNPHDSNAVRATAADGSTIGYLARDLAAKVSPVLGDREEPLSATIVAVHDCGLPGAPLGVEISFDVRSLEMIAM